MKKIQLILIANILFCLPCSKTIAQAPYKVSVGGVISPVISVGVSCKTFFGENVAFQIDLLVKDISTVYLKENRNMPNMLSYGAFEQNVNLMYQKKAKDLKKVELFWFVGGGGSVGYAKKIDHTYGKFGVNVITGLEFVFKKVPLSIQIDLRPGYGVLSYYHYSDNYADAPMSHYPKSSTLHHFDWLTGFTFRYAFKGKEKE